MSATTFNASVSVTELLTKTLENVAKDLASRCIMECAARYGFDGAEEIRMLGLENLNLIKKQMTKKGTGAKKASKEKKEKTVAAKKPKSTFPLPFSSANMCGCQGLAFNRGLFTQCTKDTMENGNFCQGCQSEADKNASGEPDCGTVAQRIATGLYEFKDPKGRSPVSYVKVLEKLKLSVEQAMEEAGNQGIELSTEHFEVKTKEKMSARGRPKKPAASIEAENVSDLFTKLAIDAEIVEAAVEEVQEKKKSAKLSEEEKAAKKAELEAQREQKKQERSAQQAAEKEAKALKLAEEKAKIAEEKAAKIAEEKAAKALKIAEEKAKIAEEKAAKSAKSAKKPAEKKAKVQAEAAPVVAVAVPEPAPTKVSVSKITIDGKEYLKSAANILYDPATKEEMGLYDPLTKTIKELPEEDEEEEEEDDYESEEEA
jgi:hypothetical protein